MLTAIQTTADTIKDALAHDRLLVQYQPIINLKIPAMACYSIQIHIECPDHRLISDRDLRHSGIDSSLQYQIDQWIITHALQDLIKLRQSMPLARLSINLSASTIADTEFPAWLGRQLKLHELVGAGLILCIRITDIINNLKEVQQNFQYLKKINVETCITRFPEKLQAFKLLKFLHAEYISISPRLLKADKNTINTIVENAKKLKAKILLTEVDHAESLNLQWATGADLLQGTYIHGLMDDMSFDFG